MKFLNFFRKLFSVIFPSQSLIEDVTPANIEKLKRKLLPKDYRAWLKKKLFLVRMLIEEREMEGISVPQEILEKKKLLQEKLKEIGE